MGYVQKPGVTGNISAGGIYDNLDTVDSISYQNLAAESAAAAKLSADKAAISETNAGVSEANAADSADLAASSAASVGSGVATAVAAAATATTQAGIATTGANTATTQAGIATTGAITATTQAGIATTGANTATTQAGIATTGANTATTQAGIATTGANTATTQAGIATTGANTATTQALASFNSAAASLASEVISTSSANTATTQAGIATAGANTATTQAGIATAQAISASSSAAASAAARDQALAAFDNFDDKYLGEKAADPTVDNDGNPLVTGALYFNNVDDVMKVYTGTLWTAAYISSSGVLFSANNLSDVQSADTSRINLGLGTLATQSASATAITGGSIDNTAIGNTTRSTAKVTTLNATGAVSLASSTASLVPLSIGVGTAPSAPVDGDIWVEDTGMFVKNSAYVHQVDFDTNTSGVLARTSITITGSGATLSCSSVKVLLYSTSGFSGDFKTYIVPAATGLVLVDNALNALIVSYNGGSPVFSTTTDLSLINGSSVVGAATLYRTGANVHYQAVDWGLATASNANKRSLLINGIQRASGLSLSESTGRVITLTAGSVWYASSEYAEPAITSAASNCEFWYHVGGVWTNSVVSTYNNNQYDNGTALVTLNGAGTQYAVNWVYRYINGDSLPKLAYILGTGNYNLAQAQAASVTTPPPILSSMAILVGRIIVAQAATTATQINSAFATTFAGTTVSDHNDLASLQGGALEEYFHLASSEYTGTGTGTFVRATSPTLVTPILGTPTSGNLVNCTFPTLNQNTTGTSATITGVYSGTITSSQVTTGLGFTPYNATNPAGYTSNTGTVTGVSGTAPVVSSGGTAPVISMAAATASVPGYLTAADWSTFNSKQPAGTYATGTGTASGTNTGDQTNISGTAANVTGTVAVANGGTGSTTAGGALTNLGAQATLVSATNIKTINSVSLLGSGNIAVSATPAGATTQLQYNSAGAFAGSANLTFDGTNLTCAGSVTANSDETLKANWRDLPSEFIEQLANVKHGIYDRLDIDLTQEGVSAQSLQPLLPNSVLMGEDGKLSVAYGNAALVAAIQLAKRVVDLEARIEMLEQMAHR